MRGSMPKFLGSYGVLESALSVIIFCFFVYFNSLYYHDVFAKNIFSNQVQFAVIFIDLIGLVLISFPYVSKKLSNIPNSAFNKFLDLPSQEDKISFSTISEFLGNQALASFLATVLIFTGKQALEDFGGAITAVYVAFLFLIALSLGSISLIRFMLHFSNQHWIIYTIASALSTGIMFSFFHLGLKMAI